MIVAIATDAALLRSLAFALTVDGFIVETFDSWQAACGSIAKAMCVIVDADICRQDGDARKALLDPESRMVLLSDGMTPPLDHANARVIAKPLTGQDVYGAVGMFRERGK